MMITPVQLGYIYEGYLDRPKGFSQGGVLTVILTINGIGGMVF